MRLFTTMNSRWLLTLLVAVCFSGTAMAQRTVTLQLNTATLPDTTSAETTIQIRGALVDAASQELPDGNVIDWGDATTLEAMNVGGDYWYANFQIPDSTEMRFKFFSQQAEDAGVGGWEDNISDGADNNSVIPAGVGDTTLALHFFNKAGDQPYLWRPFEAPDDSIGVWFRVYMNTESALNAGFDRTSDSLVVGVRGDDFAGSGPLDWNATDVILTPESDTENTPGYDLFSGVAYYPDSLAGSNQAFKFVFADKDGLFGWEANNPVNVSGNREFVIPSSDSTLVWDFFSYSPAATGEMQVTSTLLFAVDTAPLEAIGLYDRGRGDSLEVRGSFNGWGCDNPLLCEMQRVPGEDLFEGAFDVTAFAETSFDYKYFINFNDVEFESAFGEAAPSGWEEPISTTGANRNFVFEGTSQQDIGLQFFNDVLPGNIIPDGNEVAVTFQVRMDSALVDMAAPFDPAVDTVTVQVNDALWSFTQGIKRDGDGNFQIDTGKIVLTDDDGDGLYTGTMMVAGPTYGAIQYKYAYGGDGTFANEGGGGFSDAGRNRTRYIAANSDGSWPTEWMFPEEVYLVEGLLPFEDNPAVGVSIERTSDELPNKIALEANYPNPFNPVTTIEFSLTKTEQVALNVYDLTGRLISTVFDGVQPAGTYQVTFDAEGLASGMYLYRLESASTTITRKMVLLK